MSASQFIEHAREFLPILLQGAVVTVEVTLLSFVFSTVLGLVLALTRLSPVRALAWGGGAVINLIRGLPIIVQLFYIYFVLPDIGIQLTAFQAGVIGLGIAYSPYQAENFRAGPQAFLRAVMDDPSVPLALRIEAAKALLAAGPNPG